MIGRRIGSWILERELGHGGMGAVFLGRHAKLGTPAAVKALAPLPGVTPELQERFEREAEVHAGLRHPHVARVHDFLQEDGTWFLVIEYLPGGSLAERLEDGTPAPRRAIGWIRQALAGLGHAHTRGVVHRDVKPANLMLDEHGDVKVTDFGIARPRAGAQLTSTGTTLGTVQYMSPEQLEGLEDVDHRSDLYSTGAVLYELLAGEPPFAGESLSRVLRSRLIAPEPLPLGGRVQAVDPRLEEIVHRCLAMDRHDRHQSAEELRRDLEPFAAGAGGGGGAPGGGTVLWSRPGPRRDRLPRLSPWSTRAWTSSGPPGPEPPEETEPCPTRPAGDPVSRRTALPGAPPRPSRFHAAEEGTHALEALLAIGFTVVPCCWALLLLEEMLAESLGLEIVVLSSPFF